MASTTPGEDVEASSTDDVEGSSIQQKNFRDSGSASVENLVGPSSSSNLREGAFKPERHLIDDQHHLDLFSFGDVSSHCPSQSFVSSAGNTTGYDGSHEFGAISSTLPPVFENLFGQSPPDDVGGPFSMDDVVHTGYAPWDDIDVLSVGLNVPKVLMQGSEADDGVDESDGTFSKLPDSSSSKSGKSKSKESLVPDSRNEGRVSTVLDHNSSPLFQYEGCSPDYQQRSSSSDLSIPKPLPPPPKLDPNKSSHSSAASTSRCCGRENESETLIDPTETPSKILQFIEPDPIDPNNFFDVKSVVNDENVSQKPAASSSSDPFSHEELFSASQRDFVSLSETTSSSFMDNEHEEDEASSSPRPSVSYYHQEKISPTASPKDSNPVKKSKKAESPLVEFPISSSSSVSKTSLFAEREERNVVRSDIPLQELTPLNENSLGKDQGLFSEISASLTNKSLDGVSCPEQNCVSSSKTSLSTSQSTILDKSKDGCRESPSPVSRIESSTNVAQLTKKKKVRKPTQQKSPESAEVETSGHVSPAGKGLMKGQRSANVTQGVSSSVHHRPKNSSIERHESMKTGNGDSSASGLNSKSRTAPDSQEELPHISLKHSVKRQFDSRIEPSTSNSSGHPFPNQLEVLSGKNGSNSNVSRVDASGEAGIEMTTREEGQIICSHSRSSTSNVVVPLMPSTSVNFNTCESQIAPGGSRNSRTTKYNTTLRVTIHQDVGSSNQLGDEMDKDQAAASSDPTVENDLSHNQHISKATSDLTSMDWDPSFHKNMNNLSQNMVDHNIDVTSEAETAERSSFMDAIEPVDLEQGTLSSTAVAPGQETSEVGEGIPTSVGSILVSGVKGDSSTQEEYEACDEVSDSSDSDIDIDHLLDKDLPVEYKERSKGKKRTLDGEEKLAESSGQQDEGGEPEPGKEPGVISFAKKTVLLKKGREPLEGLPEQWISTTHRSGMTVYIHRSSRVCTWSRPYFLGPGSLRKHRVPLASIPCLHYMRAKEAEASTTGGQQKKLCASSSSSCDNGRNRGEAGATATSEESIDEFPEMSHASESQGRDVDGSISEATTVENGTDSAPAEGGEKGVATGRDNDPNKNKVEIRPDETLEPEELNAYAKKVFEFEDVVTRKFKKWSDKRNFWKSRREKEKEKVDRVDRPQLPPVPLFDVEMPSTTSNKANRTKECPLNMKGKTPIAILHEYCQKVLRSQPKYEVVENNNSLHPFEAVVFIEGTKYGRGQASSKKVARLHAARETLEILLPEVMARQEDEDDGGIEFFNQISIDDPRVLDLCTKTGQMTPFGVLQDYQQRMLGQNSAKYDFQVTVNRYQKLEYTMSLGKYKAQGPCKSSRIGKQLGAQQILKQLYPKITTWGGIIKLYGKGVGGYNKAKKEEQKKILALSKRQDNIPNEKILEKLRNEMLKIYGPQRDSDPISGPTCVAPTLFQKNPHPADQSSSQVQNQVDT